MRIVLMLAALLAVPAVAHAGDCSDATTFGVVGGARAADGTWNPQPTDTSQALQSAIDACAGQTLVVPPGAYYLHGSGGGAMLAITQPMALVFSPGAVLYVQGDQVTDVLLVETPANMAAWSALRPVDVRVNIRGWHFASGSYRHGVVVHQAATWVHDSQVNEAGGWGVLVESGTAGSSLVGATRLSPGTYANANFCRLSRLVLADDGDQGYPGDSAKGGGVWVHGSDANGVEVSDSVATYVNVGFADGSLEGVTWRRNYVEVGGQTSAVGFMDWSSAGARYYDCREEIAHPSTPGPHSRAIGGTLFRGTAASAVDADLTSIAAPLRNTVDHWTWRQTGVSLPAGASVVRSASSWATSYGLCRGDLRTTSDRVHVTATVEMHTANAWGQRLSAQQADAQVAARAASLLALDVSCGPVATGYQDDAGGLFLARCVNATPQPVMVDIVWSVEMWTPSTPNTSGP